MKPKKPGLSLVGNFKIQSLYYVSIQMFYFCLESVSVICVFLGILPFSLSYLIYGHTIIQNTLIILFISTVMSPLLFPILRLSSSPPP